MPDGSPVCRYRLGSVDGLELHVWDYGAIVAQLWVPDAEGRRVNVVLGCTDLAGYLEMARDYYGAVVGRFANRIAGGELPLDGATYRLVRNDGSNTLHGGPDGFACRLWGVVDVGPTSIELALVSPTGDQGFPGALELRVRYTVTEDEVRIEYAATADAPTVVNPTQHAHFNLAGEGEGTVVGHLLAVRASRYTPIDADLIPIGELAPVDGTPLDLREAQALSAGLQTAHEQLDLAHGYDHNYVLDGPAHLPAAVLTDPGSGRVLELFTDAPGVQVYSGNFFDGSNVGPSGRPYPPRAGIALETQLFPDAPHHEGEPGWPSAVLRPGERFTSTTTWRFRTT